jgi:hypothetical protein
MAGNSSNQELTRILASLVAQNASARKPSAQQVTGLSAALLSSVGPQKPWDSHAQMAKDSRGPSFVNRILDLMSRPLYAADSVIKGALDRTTNTSDPLAFAKQNIGMLSPITNPQLLRDAWSGLSGKTKTTGRDLIQSGENISGQQMPDGIGKAALGMALDIGTDPLTYVGGLGLASKLGKAEKLSTEGLKAVEEGTGRTAQTLSQQISERASQQASKLNSEVPQLNAPAPLPEAPPRTFAAGPSLRDAEATLPAERLPERAPGPAEGLPSEPLAIEAGPSANTKAPLDIIRETLAGSKAGKSELAKALEKIPEGSDLDSVVKVLSDAAQGTKSPVAKALLRKQIDKLQAGVKPADILSKARVLPADFPQITIGDRWVEAAKSAADKFLEGNRLKDINHVGQSNLYNRVLHAASKVRKDRRPFTVLQMLRVAEDEVLGAGRSLTDAEGISVRLSDVANMAGGHKALGSRLVDDFRKARPSQQIEDLKAFTTPQVASKIIDPVVKTAEDLSEPLKALPPSQTVKVGSPISKELTKLAQAAGASSREAKTAKQFIDDLFNISRDKLYSPIAQEARNLVRQSSTGVVDSNALYKVSEQIYKSLGVNAKVLGRELNQTKVQEAIMTKFATWWGAKDLKPWSREYIDTAKNVASAFAETITPLIRKTTATQRATAWSVATGKLSAGTPEEAALAQQFKHIVERLMGTHGITDNAEAVVLRSGTVMKELNDALPKSLQFVANKGKDVLGRDLDYSNGQWMHSWQEWQGGEPAEKMYQLTRALQMVTRKNSMWDDAAARWGLPVKSAEYQHTVAGIPRLAGTHFPKQIADQLGSLQRQLERDVFKAPHKAIELFDKVQRIWKTGVTIYSPSHHIRNLNGDVYLAALDGVISPKPYAIATKVLHAFPTRHKDLESVFNIMDPALRDSALHARPGNVVVTTRAGEKLTAEQVYQAAESQGLFVRATNIEELGGEGSGAFGTFGAKFQPLGGKLYGAATRASELRDHWVRLAHFVDVISKSNQPLRVAVEQAGRRVRKFHPDGMDLTGFEQNVLRRVIPFYSWMRKSIPLVIEGAVMRPHITLAFPKAEANMQLATGIESQGPGDPFPVDQMFPDWLREKGIGPILQPGSGIGRQDSWRGHAPGYTIINPTNPFTDTLSQIGNPGQTLFSGLSPAARIPIELLTGQTSLGIPLESVQGGTPGYLAQQIPAVGIAARLSGQTRNNEPYSPEQLINWLTSAGVTGTGPYEPQAQTEIRDLITQAAKKNRGDYR